VSFRVTIPCTRAQGEAIVNAEDRFHGSDDPPVLVADEPDPSKPDEWLIHAYFDHHPDGEEMAILTVLGSGPPQIEQLGEQDWVTMSQAGLQPIRAGRFHVHTPTYPPDPDRINFEIDAGLAFGTGQHATTAGCLEALDRLEREGALHEHRRHRHRHWPARLCGVEAVAGREVHCFRRRPRRGRRRPRQCRDQWREAGAPRW
jgi:ribosomal protein L11 methyltransferase